MPKIKDFYHRIEIIDECFRQKGKKWGIDALLKLLIKNFGTGMMKQLAKELFNMRLIPDQ
jgi:hypothetical protein